MIMIKRLNIGEPLCHQPRGLRKNQCHEKKKIVYGQLGNEYRVEAEQRNGRAALRFDVLIGTYRSVERLLRRCCTQKTKRKTAASSLICEGRKLTLETIADWYKFKLLARFQGN